MFRVLTKFLPSFITEFWITVLRVKLDRLMFNQDLRSVEWMNEWMNEKMNEWKRNNRRPRRANVDVENQTRRGNQILAAKTEPIRRRACLPNFFFLPGFSFFWLPLFLSRTFSWHQLRRHGYRIFYYYFFFTRFQSGSKKEGRSFLFFIFRYLLLLFFKNKYLDAPRIKVALVGKSRE